MNSTGLSILINIFTQTRNRGGEVVITNIPEKINKLLIITKLNSIFNIEETVEAAKKAFPSWSLMSAEKRSAYILKIVEGIENNLDDLADALLRFTRRADTRGELPPGEAAGSAPAVVADHGGVRAAKARQPDAAHTLPDLGR